MDIVNLVAQHGGTLGLAIFAIWMLNKVWELRLEEVQRYSKQLEDINCQVRDAINRNTEAWITMMERVRE